MMPAGYPGFVALSGRAMVLGRFDAASLPELEVSPMRRAVVQREDQLTTGAGPPSLRLPHVDILNGVGVMRETVRICRARHFVRIERARRVARDLDGPHAREDAEVALAADPELDRDGTTYPVSFTAIG
jgi:hypothetical protein